MPSLRLIQPPALSGDVQTTMSASDPAMFCQTGSKRSSRSTSPESTAESGSCDHSSSRGSVNSSDNASAQIEDNVSAQIEDHEASSQYIIRNTFISTVDERSTSLEGFFNARQVCSCPPTRAASREKIEDLSQMIADSIGGIVVAEPQDSDASYVVRNTFIETALGRPPSLEGFYQERQASSCPPTRLASVDEEQVLLQRLEGLDGKVSKAYPAAVQESVLPQQQSVFEIARQDAAEPDKLLLLLHDALGMLDVGSAELPSVGSREHASGSCKPCAFYHSRTCKSGEDCSFCHLCGPGEKKRRQRIKEEQVRAAKQQPATSATSDPVFNSILQSLQGAGW